MIEVSLDNSGLRNKLVTEGSVRLFVQKTLIRREVSKYALVQKGMRKAETGWFMSWCYDDEGTCECVYKLEGRSCEGEEG